MGSVGETIAPNRNAAGQVRPSTSACATVATASVVAPTRPSASSEIGRTFALPERVEERGRVEQGRQEGDEHEVGVELELRQPGYEPQHEPADDEEDGVRDAYERGQHDEAPDGDEQDEDDELVVGDVHAF